MSDAFCTLDYGEQLVLRYRTSGLTRKDFAKQEGISASTLDYYVRRERGSALPATYAPNRIVAVDVVASEEEPSRRDTASAFPAGVAIRLANGRTLEVQRGFDRELLLDVLAALEANSSEERG